MKDSASYLFNQIANVFWNNLEKIMSEAGLHAGQFFVLAALWEKDGQSQAELVRELRVSPPTIFNMVKRMTQTGFVELKRNQSDARLARVFLTEKGLQIKPELETQWVKLEEMSFSELSETEKMMFTLLLKKIKKL